MSLLPGKQVRNGVRRAVRCREEYVRTGDGYGCRAFSIRLIERDTHVSNFRRARAWRTANTVMVVRRGLFGSRGGLLSAIPCSLSCTTTTAPVRNGSVISVACSPVDTGRCGASYDYLAASFVTTAFAVSDKEVIHQVKTFDVPISGLHARCSGARQYASSRCRNAGRAEGGYRRNSSVRPAHRATPVRVVCVRGAVVSEGIARSATGAAWCAPNVIDRV